MNARDQVHRFLKDERRKLEGENLMRAKRALIDRVLAANGVEAGMLAAWDDILDSCRPGCPPNSLRQRWQIVVDRLIEVAVDYSPQEIKVAHDAIKRIGDKNIEIADSASRLARLIRERDSLKEGLGLNLVGERNPIDLMSRAAEISERRRVAQLYPAFVESELLEIRKRFKALRSQFNWQYWPEAAALIEAFSESHFDMAIEIEDERLEAAFKPKLGEKTTKRTPSDFLRVFLAEVENLGQDDLAGNLLDLRDKSVAALCTVLTGHTFTAVSVNRHRNR